MAIEQVETYRLRGKRVRESHFPLWFEMGSNPIVMATMGGIWSKEKARQKIRWNCQQWEHNGHGQWTWFDKATEQFVGRGGIRKVVVDNRPEIELGYALMPEFWGRGLAVEIGEKSLAVAFEQFGYSNVVCYTSSIFSSDRNASQMIVSRYELRLKSRCRLFSRHLHEPERSPLHLLIRLVELSTWRFCKQRKPPRSSPSL